VEVGTLSCTLFWQFGRFRHHGTSGVRSTPVHILSIHPPVQSSISRPEDQKIGRSPARTKIFLHMSRILLIDYPCARHAGLMRDLRRDRLQPARERRGLMLLFQHRRRRLVLLGHQKGPVRVRLVSSFFFLFSWYDLQWCARDIASVAPPHTREYVWLSETWTPRLRGSRVVGCRWSRCVCPVVVASLISHTEDAHSDTGFTWAALILEESNTFVLLVRWDAVTPSRPIFSVPRHTRSRTSLCISSTFWQSLSR